MKAFLPVAALAATAFLSMPALAQGEKMDNSDAAAMKQLAQANLNEVEAGKAAESKAQSIEVKQFAKKMQEDHAKMYDDLKRLAQQKGVTLPQSASLRDMAEMKKVEHASGKDFDKEYMQHMVKDHEKDAQETQELASKVKDPQFRDEVEKAHEKIEEHLHLAQQIAGKTSAAGGSSKK